tara:strand:+ start:3450 stop:4496 length:1047 start_codon:yes stop_codon:yes gene_type:complete
MLAHPTSFSIPRSKWEKYEDIRNNIQKEIGFSQVVPLVSSYSYDAESEYIVSYAKCYFAITFRKGGWESLRHYEILLAGTLPYFLHVDLMDEKCLYCFPKKLLKRIHNLPGLPSEDFIIENIRSPEKFKVDFDKFDFKKYNELRNELLNHAQQNMLCSQVTHRMLLTSQNNTETFPKNLKNIKNILVHSSTSRGPQDYQRDLTIIGLLELGFTVYTMFDISFIFEDTENDLSKLYGRGFTYGKSLDISYRDKWKQINTIEEFPKENSLYIFTTKSNLRTYPGFCLDEGYDPKIFINGNDDLTHVDMRESPDNKSCIFFREYTSLHMNKYLLKKEKFYHFMKILLPMLY